jgi:uncharacterized protein
MLRKYVASQRASTKKPGLGFWLLANSWNILSRLQNKAKFPVDSFIRANRLSADEYPEDLTNNKSIEILFVAAGKDLEMLPWAIPAAITSVNTSPSKSQVTVIVPSRETSRCNQILKDFKDVRVISEDTVIPHQVSLALKEKYAERSGWALQQFIKIAYVMESQMDGVLIVDADTILLKKRNWLSVHGEQILTPSDEYNVSYYDFLSSIGIGQLKPEFTFVSHHMLMQPLILREAFESINLSFPNDVLRRILDYKFLSDSSPFSIDYEFYGQYLFNNYPSDVKLQKWANVGLPRSANLDAQIMSETKRCQGRYYSISFHSYL